MYDPPDVKDEDKGIIQRGKRWFLRWWKLGSESPYDRWTLEGEGYEITPSTVWNSKELKIEWNPGYVDVEVEYTEYYEMGGMGTDYKTVEIPLEVLAEVLRRSGYEVKKT